MVECAFCKFDNKYKDKIKILERFERILEDRRYIFYICNWHLQESQIKRNN